MAKTKTTVWDPSEYLNSEAHIAAFLNAAFEETGDDPAFIAKAFGIVAKARGMTQLARKSGVSRDTLYKALGDGSNPNLGTLLKVAKGLGLKLRVA